MAKNRITYARVIQANRNIGYILAGMYNDLQDHNVESYTEEEVLNTVYGEMFDMLYCGGGCCRYATGICDDLKFLGKEKIYDLIRKSDDFDAILHYND